MLLISYHYFIDRQKIAKILCKNITKETRKATRLVQDYNKQCTEQSVMTEQSVISVSDVLSPDSPFWATQTSATSHGIPLKVRRDIIEASKK